MNLDFIKNKKAGISKGLLVISLLLVVAMAVKVLAFGTMSIRMPGRIRSAVEHGKCDDEATKERLAKFTETAGKLKAKNMFAPAPKPKPPGCTGILGDTVIINGKGYKVGEEVGGAKIVAIGPKEVTILWEGKEMKIQPFAKMPQPPPPPAKVKEAEKAELKPAAAQPEAVKNNKETPEPKQAKRERGGGRPGQRRNRNGSGEAREGDRRGR